MPIYEYQCASCGPFVELRPMALSSEPCECNDCGEMSERVILSAPHMAGMDTARRQAFQTNERSAHEPHLSTKSERLDKSSHAPGCSCCRSKQGKSSASQLSDGSKIFPTRRPWMISH